MKVEMGLQSHERRELMWSVPCLKKMKAVEKSAQERSVLKEVDEKDACFERNDDG